MNDADLAAATERVMEKVDYYLHCELDNQYEHQHPETARLQLEIAIKRELLRASETSPMSSGARVQA
ncbi:MAG: hypothetical protein EOO79_04330 [Oxalobacteraceae bacterium]|jgi:hypothetical protein|nr:MAG: hypothetical protein EOO79_04330 [Oxalobacteraceae bacterium]